MKRNKITAFVMVLSLTALSGFAGDNLLAFRQNVNYTPDDSVDTSGNKYIWFDSQHPSIMTFVNENGSVSVCAVDKIAQDTYIYEYSAAMQLLTTKKFHNEFETLGAFTKDDEGNYYFFYAKNVAEGAFTQNNMALVKYAPDSTKIKTFYLAAQTSDEIWASGYSGVRIPFNAGTCRLEISGDLIAVYFAREMFRARDGRNHQASYGFVLNKNSLERIPEFKMPSAGHSFNQFILPVDGGFIIADHGDAGPRSFTFAKIQRGSPKRLNAFTFEGASGQNATFAEMGGLAKTSKGYIFAGVYGRTVNNPRNLFILTFDDNLTACGKQVWLTNYTRETGHVAHPKITALDAGRYLVLWEKCTFTTQHANSRPGGTTGYLSTYMLIIDEQGKPLSPVKELAGIRLNMNDNLRYNRQTKKVYWAINDNQTIVTYVLDPDVE